MRLGRRSVRRWNIMWAGVLVHADNEYPCTVLDISELGAKVEVAKVPVRPSHVKLRCQQFGTLEGWLLWSRGEKAGIRFSSPPPEVFDRLKTAVPGLGRKKRAQPLAAVSSFQRRSFGRLPRPAPDDGCSK